jgi:mono/diheme cytochrome c family protein
LKPTDAGAKVFDADNGPGLVLDAFPEIEASNIEISVLPDLSYSGFDGVHTFQIPIAVYNHDPKDLTVELSDPSLADVAPATFANPQADNGRYYLVTTKKAGDGVITIKSRGKSATSKLKVKAYPAGQWEAGETRYRAAGNGQKACAECHEAADGADHSPTTLAFSEDQALEVTITTGIKSGNVPITRVQHRWTATDTELKGLVTFLRGLPPKGYTKQ